MSFMRSSVSLAPSILFSSSGVRTGNYVQHVNMKKDVHEDCTCRSGEAEGQSRLSIILQSTSSFDDMAGQPRRMDTSKSPRSRRDAFCAMYAQSDVSEKLWMRTWPMYDCECTEKVAMVVWNARAAR